MLRHVINAIDVSDVLAVIAIIVSVLTAVHSQHSAQRQAAQQQAWELRMYTYAELDSARGKIARILNDFVRTANGIIRASTDQERSALESELSDLDKEAVDVFDAIDHHLPEEKVASLQDERAAHQKNWVERGHWDATESLDYLRRILTVIDSHVRALRLADRPL